MSKDVLKKMFNTYSEFNKAATISCQSLNRGTSREKKSSLLEAVKAIKNAENILNIKQ